MKARANVNMKHEGSFLCMYIKAMHYAKTDWAALDLSQVLWKACV